MLTLLALVLLGCVLQSPPALSPRLLPGDPAPALALEHTVTGKPPSLPEPGKTIVLTFWNTRLPAGGSMMEALNALHAQFRDQGVEVIAVTEEPIERVRAFMETAAGRARPQVTLVAANEAHTRYLQGWEPGALPVTFILRDGTVQWIGHPAFAQPPLTRLLEGRWDLPEERRAFDAALGMRARAEQMKHDVAAAYRARDWDALLPLMDQLASATPASERSTVYLNKAQVLLEAGRADQAYAQIERTVRADPQPHVRCMAAGVILRTPGVTDRRVERAVALLEEVLADLPSGDAPAGTTALRTRALADLGYAWFLRHDLERAITCTRQALEVARAPGAGMNRFRDDLEQVLRDLERARDPAHPREAVPPHEPASNPPATQAP